MAQEPYIRRNPGDFIAAEDWNQIQILAREELGGERTRVDDLLAQLGALQSRIDALEANPAAAASSLLSPPAFFSTVLEASDAWITAGGEKAEGDWASPSIATVVERPSVLEFDVSGWLMLGPAASVELSAWLVLGEDRDSQLPLEWALQLDGEKKTKSTKTRKVDSLELIRNPGEGTYAFSSGYLSDLMKSELAEKIILPPGPSEPEYEVWSPVYAAQEVIGRDGTPKDGSSLPDRQVSTRERKALVEIGRMTDVARLGFDEAEVTHHAFQLQQRIVVPPGPYQLVLRYLASGERREAAVAIGRSQLTISDSMAESAEQFRRG